MDTETIQLVVVGAIFLASLCNIIADRRKALAEAKAKKAERSLLSKVIKDAEESPGKERQFWPNISRLAANDPESAEILKKRIEAIKLRSERQAEQSRLGTVLLEAEMSPNKEMFKDVLGKLAEADPKAAEILKERIEAIINSDTPPAP